MASSIPDLGEKKSHQCTGCGVWSPTTDTNYTLISSQFGWRLSRRLDPKEGIILQWRCPTCWAALKQKPEDQPPSSRAKKPR